MPSHQQFDSDHGLTGNASRRPTYTPVTIIVTVVLTLLLSHLLMEFSAHVLHLPWSIHVTMLLESLLVLSLVLPVLYRMVLKPILERNMEIRQVEAALRESEARYRRIVETAQEGIWITDEAGITLFVNVRMAEMLGYTPDEMRGRPFYSFMDQTSRQNAQQTLAAGLPAIIGQHDRCFLRKDGAQAWAISSVTMLTADNGTPMGLMAMVTDITERKNAEREIAHLASFPNLNPHPIVELTLEGEVRFANRGALTTLQRLGLPQDGSAFFPADMADLLARFARDHSGSEYREVAVGEAFFAVYLAYVETMQTVRLYASDITRQVKALEETRLAGMVIEHTMEGVTITDPEGTIVFVNPAFTAITGYTAEEAVGRNPRVLKSDRHDEAFYREMWQALTDQGFWQGEIWNRRKSGAAYPEWLTISAVRNDQGKTTHYVAVFHDITEMKEQAERIQHQAHHDALTGLPNRALFLDRLEQALAHSQRQRELLAVIFVDLDRFKAVNDSLGHKVGDLLLQAVAERLSGCVRAEDTVARLGGDEFIVLLTNLTREEDAAHVAEKVQAAFTDPFHLDGHDLFVTPSMGITLYPTDGIDAGTLLQNADVALYRAKEQGRNTYRLYTPAMNDRALERLELEGYLRKAVEHTQFRLVYQPRVDVSTGKVTSAEALIRWEHPELGTVMPGKFIPLAEETGLIIPMGEWVLREACGQANAWRQAGLPPIRVAVNVSGRQFAKGDLVDVVQRTLEESGLPPEYLEIEITESVAMTDVAGTLATLQALSACGVWIAIDDFGTSYSSLGYLKQFPLHALKIDQSFVREIPDDANSVAIATAIISLAHALHLHVIAEGVETETQLGLLKRHACDEVQGYLFSKPIPPDEFRHAFLADGTLEARQAV